MLAIIALVIKILLKIPRSAKHLIIMLFDLIALIACVFLAFYFRLGYWVYPANDNDLFLSMFFLPIIALPIFISFGLYRQVIRYFGNTALWHIIQAVTLYSSTWGLTTFIFSVENIPRSVILINWLLAIIIICSSRLFARWILSEVSMNHNVLVYGAGSAGRQLSSALSLSFEYKPVAFIDDSQELLHQSVNGLKVYSPDSIADLIKNKNIKEILLAIPSISRFRRKEIINFLEQYSVLVRSLPGVTELVQGKVSVDDLIDINLKDLLGRQSVGANKKLLKTNITNKKVMVTGAGGSIGQEICRQILFLKPKSIVLFEISESSLYLIDQELNDFGITGVEIFPVIGSIADLERVKYICKYYDIKTIYHAAAYKHVPLVECNPSQGFLNNSIGTLKVAEAAIASNVETFVLISTDKAVRPTNVMGASKRIAELILQALAKQSHNTCFTIVRFGNVLDSSGSVIPLFRKQIANGGPVTVTHIDVVRYFMTIPEAVELVLQAGAMSKGGDVFLLDMGKPIRIYNLAVKMIQLSGLQVADDDNPKGDIEIKFTGLRPGEKLYEELLIDGNFTLTENKLIMRAEESMIEWDKLKPVLAEIEDEAKNGNTKKIYKLLNKIVPQFNSENNNSID